MNDIDYSFSKKLDQLRKLKCIGYKTFSMSKHYPNIPFKVPEMEVKLEMKEVPIDNEKIILKMIQQFETDKHLLQQ